MSSSQPSNRGLLSADTAADIEQRQIERWRRMSPQAKLALMGDLCDTARHLAEIGIRLRFPQAGERERFLRLAELRLGSALARRVYPEINWSA